MEESRIEILTELFKKTWNTYWEIGIVIPIFKKGNNMECQNYKAADT